jgi:hypothetical protein
LLEGTKVQTTTYLLYADLLETLDEVLCKLDLRHDVEV